jgi:hypothetical protein
MTTTKRTYKSGQNRTQASFLPPCLEDYVSRDNPVRAIDAYVDSLELSELGLRDVGSDGGAGQPPYDPADLLRLYLYGYLHQVRSSRRLEREARLDQIGARSGQPGEQPEGGVGIGIARGQIGDEAGPALVPQCIKPELDPASALPPETPVASGEAALR